MKFLIRWFVSAISIYVIASLAIGVRVESFKATLVAAAILGIINTIIRPILIILTLPLNIITLGLFTFVINGITLKMTSNIVGGFEVSNLLAGIVSSVLISLVNMILSSLLGVEK